MASLCRISLYDKVSIILSSLKAWKATYQDKCTWFFWVIYKIIKIALPSEKHTKKYHLEGKNNFLYIQDTCSLNNVVILYLLSRKVLTGGTGTVIYTHESMHWRSICYFMYWLTRKDVPTLKYNSTSADLQFYSYSSRWEKVTIPTWPKVINFEASFFCRLSNQSISENVNNKSISADLSSPNLMEIAAGIHTTK